MTKTACPSLLGLYTKRQVQIDPLLQALVADVVVHEQRIALRARRLDHALREIVAALEAPALPVVKGNGLEADG